MDTDGARRLNRLSPSCLNSGAQRTDFFHGLLGATTSEIVRLFVIWGLRITGVSLAVGLFLSIAFGKVVEGLLVNVSSPDWLSIGLVVLLVLGVTLIGCYVPVRRLVGSSPTRELQHE